MAKPTNMLLIAAASVPAQAWRNGGGQTRELLTWPAGDAWQLRVSRADIDRDGPFSAFPQVQRWFAVLQGQGVVLDFAGEARTMRSSDEALCFDGAAAPGCRLLDGPTQDLNLMLRQGAGTVRRWQVGQAWSDGFVMRGLYTTLAGRWLCDRQAIDLAADTLMWWDTAATGPWTFLPHPASPGGNAWWLGFTPRS